MHDSPNCSSSKDIIVYSHQFNFINDIIILRQYDALCSITTLRTHIRMHVYVGSIRPVRYKKKLRCRVRTTEVPPVMSLNC
jgi:hypothetical protein